MIYQLAPMEAVTCWAFRALCTKFGADRTYTEMIRAKALGKDNNASWSLIDTYGEESCHLQLAANNTQEIDAFFLTLDDRRLVDRHLENVQGYNLNLGCPSPEVIDYGGGAALIKRVNKVCEIIKAMAEQTNLPITIKMRLGLNQREMENKVYLNLIDGLNSLELENFKEIIVHLKHAQEKSTDKAHRELVPEIMEKWKGDLTLNGGYSDHSLPKEPVYGVMFARSALKDPAVFAKVKGEKVGPGRALMEYGRLCQKHKPKLKYTEYISQNSGMFKEMFRR